MTEQLAQIRESIKRGSFDEARRLALCALDHPQDEETRARLTLNLAIATHRTGHALEALAILTENVSLFDRAPLIVQAHVHNERGIILYKLDRTNEASGEYERAVSIYEGEGRPLYLASSLNNLALCLSRQGKHKEARTRATEARQIWEAHGDRARTAQALDTLAQVLQAEGQRRAAARAALRAIVLLKQTGHAGRIRSARATYREILQAGESEQPPAPETPAPSNPARAPQRTHAP